MTDDAATSALRALRTALLAIWRFGSVVVIGWTPSPGGIEVLTVPVTRLFEQIHLHRRLMTGERRMGRRTFADIVARLGVQPVEIRLATPVDDRAGALSPDDIERTVTPFSIQHTDQRAVFLIDISGFSLLAPEQQALQITTLEFALDLAAATIRERMKASRFVRSTTGDGFYVWCAEKGVEADLSLLAMVVATLTFLGCLARSPAAAGVPRLRSAFGIGSHYTYRRPGADGAADTEYIVGQITIELARLVGAAAPGQILIGDFVRRQPGADVALGTVEFLERASESVTCLRGLSLPGTRIDRLALYLTGPGDGHGGFGIHPIDVVDKHGLSHRCFNMKVNVFVSDGQPFYCGLQHDAWTSSAG